MSALRLGPGARRAAWLALALMLASWPWFVEPPLPDALWDAWLGASLALLAAALAWLVLRLVGTTAVAAGGIHRQALTPGRRGLLMSTALLAVLLAAAAPAEPTGAAIDLASSLSMLVAAAAGARLVLAALGPHHHVPACGVT